MIIYMYDHMHVSVWVIYVKGHLRFVSGVIAAKLREKLQLLIKVYSNGTRRDLD